ncbi:uncharacterized protein [Clytia hemisphaerica]|uniref:uncharacterized protein n=1 Tax=Clytia hemisphaerica TaxID=252671 RepID=UPI0034D486BB
MKKLLPPTKYVLPCLICPILSYVFLSYVLPADKFPRVSRVVNIFTSHVPTSSQASARYWEEWNQWRVDYHRYEEICPDFNWLSKEALPWFQLANHTDPTRGIVHNLVIKPVYQFSIITLQTQNKKADLKQSGGDHWRVQIKGPYSASSLVRKIDHRNGSYEFRFVPVVSGTYQALIWLEYTLCAGLKEPPPDWFIKGTVQGKEQKQGSLHRDSPFINKPLWSGAKFQFYVPPPAKKLALQEHSTSHCKSQGCQFLWNGFGNWLNKTHWVPRCPHSTELRYPKEHPRRGLLWIFGDSVSSQFYHQIKFHPLCQHHFARCMYSYNWLYSLENYNASLGRYTRRNTTIEKTTWDDLDYNVNRTVAELRQVLLHPGMQSRESVLLLNYGLHFTESLNYTNYKTAIESVIDVLKREAYCHVVWRTTTSLNRHKYSQPNLHSRRFMTSPRVELYNAYAASRFCEEYFDVLDVYPLTDSYPEGTGSSKTPHDPVHYEYHVMRPMEKLLERVFKVK